MADNAAIYSSLKDNQEAIWGARARTIDYQYNANGAMTRKLTYTTNEQYPETNFIEKEVYSYNLQGRLKQVEFTDASGTTTTVYTYNADGIRIKKDVDSGDEVTTYLIDPMNHTGYAQVIEETITLSNDDVTYISYVIGDDVNLASPGHAGRCTLRGRSRDSSSPSGAVNLPYNWSSPCQYSMSRFTGQFPFSKPALPPLVQVITIVYDGKRSPSNAISCGRFLPAASSANELAGAISIAVHMAIVGLQ